MDNEAILDSVAPDGSPGQAFATHKARANDMAKFCALTRRLRDIKNEQAGEDNVMTLLAHLHMLSLDPEFKHPEDEPSKMAVPAALGRLNRGNGLVGTHGASTHRDYDMAVRVLIVLIYRYYTQLGDGLITYIMKELLPDYLVGGHPSEIEIVELTFLEIDVPETENHLLMIESSRYLINQKHADHSEDSKYDNHANGLKDYLLGFMQNILCHDFLEFNARPYQRLSIHALLNLHEFARDPEIKSAAQMLLDYTMMKFALSSNRGRRVGPFRRLQERINHQANDRNYLYAESGDQTAGFFLTYTGLLDSAGKPTRFPASLQFPAIFAGLAAYRPPPAAYILAMKRDNPPSLHRFYHGKRPRLTASPDDAEGGLEIYHHSPSFVISAGGSFLNSGYGRDQISIGSKLAWQQTSRAQATNVIPSLADTAFHDLIRFEPWPDPAVEPYHEHKEDPECLHSEAVNYGVVRGFAAGSNMRPAERKTVLEEKTSAAPALAHHKAGLFAAWKSVGHDTLNVAKVQVTTLMGIDGVEGVEQKLILSEESNVAPALASHNGRLFLAWTGLDDNLNIAFSDDDGKSFKGKMELGSETSDGSPALASNGDRLFLAWTGTDDKLNVARVVLIGNTAGAFSIGGIEGKVTLDETSNWAPALVAHDNRLFIAWKGSDDKLNLAFSVDSGGSFLGKKTFDDTSKQGPSLASDDGRLFIAWKGTDNNLNVAHVILIGNTQGGFAIAGLDGNVSLGDTSERAPAVAVCENLLCLAWKGDADDNLDLRVSRDGRFGPVGKWICADRSNLGFYLAAYRTVPAEPAEALDSLGFIYLAEKVEMDKLGINNFNSFQDTVKNLNGHLPDELEQSSHYIFNAPDGRKIEFWLQCTGEKYTARVVDLSEPIRDFISLPLVSGEYMRSPGGHDGLIEIRDPGCDSPLVLDFRNPESPKRMDNRGNCPGPWIERQSAMYAAATHLETINRSFDANVARIDAALLYDELTASQLGPQIVLEMLGAIGIDFSVPENDIKNWLANPFTPYPAMAQAILSLGRKLKAPVFIDVISFNYDATPGVESPRAAKDVRVDILRAAIIKSWNIRYAANVAIKDFDLLFI